MANEILKSKGAQESFLATGRMNPSAARAMRKRMELTRKRAGKKPAPRKPPKEKRKPPHRLLPIRPERKGPRRIKKPAERISSFQKFNIARDVRKRG